MRSRYVEFDDFIGRGSIYQPQLLTQDYAAMGIRPEMIAQLDAKAAEQYFADLKSTKSEYVKLSGDFESMCDTKLILRLQRMDV